jgi:hypothetical protein
VAPRKCGEQRAASQRLVVERSDIESGKHFDE